MKHILASVVILLGGSGLPSAAQSFAAPSEAEKVVPGIEAAQQGNFQEAISIWTPLASEGNRYAQFWLGDAYLKGTG